MGLYDKSRHNCRKARRTLLHDGICLKIIILCGEKFEIFNLNSWKFVCLNFDRKNYYSTYINRSSSMHPLDCRYRHACHSAFSLNRFWWKINVFLRRWWPVKGWKNVKGFRKVWWNFLRNYNLHLNIFCSLVFLVSFGYRVDQVVVYVLFGVEWRWSSQSWRS